MGTNLPVGRCPWPLDLKFLALLDDGVKSRLRGAFADYRLLLVRDEHISAANQLNFAKEFWRYLDSTGLRRRAERGQRNAIRIEHGGRWYPWRY